jgi:hypothetical protein
MSALTDVRDTQMFEGDSIKANLLTAIKVYKGALVVRDTATGYDKPGVVGTGLVALGIADMMEPYVDTTGISSGVKTITVKTGVAMLANYASDLVTVADRGKPCFIFDDQTVARTDGSAARSVAGTVMDVTSRGVAVKIGSVDGTVLAAEIAAREAVTAALALTTTPGGASLVGVFDTAGKLTATTVEAALAENIDARRIALGTDGNTLPVPLVVISKTIANSAGDTDITLNATYGGIRVTHVIVEKAASSSTGGDATITVKSTANAITEAMALSGLTAGLVYRNTTIVPGYASIASGGILRITAAKSTGDAACTVTVYGYRVA